MIKRLLGILVLAGFSLGLTACNTIKGAGADIETGGEKIQGAAKKAQ